jgi:hypothetical protein
VQNSVRSNLTILFAALASVMMPSLAQGGLIFETNYYANTIGEYTTDGQVVNPALITGLNEPYGITVSDGYIYVTNSGSGTVGKYTTSGQTVNAALITGVNDANGVVVSGNDLFVLSGGPVVGKYTTAGTTTNATLIHATGTAAGGLTIQGDDLFVTDADGVTEYTTSGATVARLASRIEQATGIAILGSTLYVTTATDFTVATVTTSGAVNKSFIGTYGVPLGIAAYNGNFFITDGYQTPDSANTRIEEYAPTGQSIAVPLFTVFNEVAFGIAVVDDVVVPEPSSRSLAALGIASLAALVARRTKRDRDKRTSERISTA